MNCINCESLNVIYCYFDEIEGCSLYECMDCGEIFYDYYGESEDE